MQEEKRLILKRMYLTPRVTQLPWEREYGRAIVDEAEYRKHSEDDRFAKTGLMHSLFMQARYKEARALAVEIDAPIMRDRIDDYILAEQRDEGDWCDCIAKSARHQNCLHRNDPTAACSCSVCPVWTGKVWSNKREDWADVWVCPLCGFKNFR